MEQDLPLRAASFGYDDAVYVLLRAGAGIHARNDEALRVAVIYGHTVYGESSADGRASLQACDDNTLRQSLEKGHADVIGWVVLTRPRDDGSS